MLPEEFLDTLALFSVIGTTVLAALAATAFVASYARYTWESTKAGRIIMAFSLAIGLRAWVAVISRYDDYHEDLDLTNITWPLVSVSWLIIAGVFFWCLRELIWRRERDNT